MVAAAFLTWRTADVFAGRSVSTLFGLALPVDTVLVSVTARSLAALLVCRGGAARVPAPVVGDARAGARSPAPRLRPARRWLLTPLADTALAPLAPVRGAADALADGVVVMPAADVVLAVLPITTADRRPVASLPRPLRLHPAGNHRPSTSQRAGFQANGRRNHVAGLQIVVDVVAALLECGRITPGSAARLLVVHVPACPSARAQTSPAYPIPARTCCRHHPRDCRFQTDGTGRGIRVTAGRCARLDSAMENVDAAGWRQRRNGVVAQNGFLRFFPAWVSGPASARAARAPAVRPARLRRVIRFARERVRLSKRPSSTEPSPFQGKPPRGTSDGALRKVCSALVLILFP
jgi:hypothetical protein